MTEISAINQYFPTGVSDSCHKWVMGWNVMGLSSRVASQGQKLHKCQERFPPRQVSLVDPSMPCQCFLCPVIWEGWEHCLE